MHTTLDDKTQIKQAVADHALNKKDLHGVTALTAELKRLLVRHDAILREEGVSRDMQRLEDWLEAERKGPAPAAVISEGGLSWLAALRDRLKLSAEESQRLEGEGGNPSSKEQSEKAEGLLCTIRRIDEIIEAGAAGRPH